MQAHPTWFDVPYGFVVLEVSIWLGNGREFLTSKMLVIERRSLNVGHC